MAEHVEDGGEVSGLLAPCTGGGGGALGERLGPRAIIAGFGLPGRSIADDLDRRQIPYVVIEVNAEVVERAKKCGRRMICGDVRQLGVLEEAGLGGAEVVALMVPVEGIVIEAVEVVRKARPDIKIVARVAFTSTGMEAKRKGADVVIVAEQVVASSATNVVGALLT